MKSILERISPLFQTPVDEEKKGLFYGILAVILWGLTFIFVKKGVEYSHPLVFTLFRLAVALPLMLFFRPKQSLVVLIGVTVIWNLGSFNFMALAMGQGVNASTAAFLQQTNSLFLILFSVLFLKEKMPTSLLISLPIAFFGLYIFFGGASLLKNISLGLVFVLGGAVASAFGMLLLKKFKMKGTFSTVVWLSGLGALIQAPLVWGSVPREEIVFSAPSFGYGVGAFVLSNIFSSIFWMKAVQLSKSASLSHLLFLIPLVVLAIDFFVLGAHIQTDHLIGGAFIILASSVRFVKIFKKQVSSG
ncbi:MAG: DMT family transporter [Alphaproteobacteria bacterium]|nr:DMT family transporter [Alphaproteobacteria bacterium]NCQ66146.1 DMT family transporter [Alphaproteobacteria bacterium]